jgi:transposase
MKTRIITAYNQRQKAIIALGSKQREQGLSDTEKDELINSLLGQNAFLEEQFAVAKQKLVASKN